MPMPPKPVDKLFVNFCRVPSYGCVNKVEGLQTIRVFHNFFFILFTPCENVENSLHCSETNIYDCTKTGLSLIQELCIPSL